MMVNIKQEIENKCLLNLYKGTVHHGYETKNNMSSNQVPNFFEPNKPLCVPL